MVISLEGKKALVGGSTQGIGKAIALQLAESGASVTLMARNREKLESTLPELKTPTGQKHGFLVADFSDLAGYKKLIDEYFRSNAVDILINNTQGPPAGTVLEKNTEDYQVAFDLLFQSVVYTTMAALPGMRKKRYGRIINVSSLTVKEPKANLVLSNTIRTALVSWAKSLSTELATENITVNSILTGYFDTERLNDLIRMQAEKQGMQFEALRRDMIDTVPVKRFGEPEEYGYLAAFLASDHSSYITGASIPIEGGILKSMY